MWFFMGGHMGAENAMAVKLGCATENTLYCQVIHYDAALLTAARRFP